VYYNGENLIGRSEKRYNQVRGAEMAMVFQDPLSSLNPVLPIGKQIAETLILHKHMKPKRARRETLALLHAVGVPGPAQRADQYPHQLSGGMRQRVAIATALACKPQLLIADEPTTSLDMTVQAEILDLLYRMQDERKMAMILVTHDLNIVAGRAHEVAVMYAGRIVEQAPAATLFSQMRMPYTRALTASIPRLDRPPHVLLHSIDGQPPDLIHPIKGCAFAPRCAHARVQCDHISPPLRPEPEPQHRLACWYPVRGSMHV
jgi:peptide/nickel transport system ATP-binding protein